jgi:hypothetical protein
VVTVDVAGGRWVLRAVRAGDDGFQFAARLSAPDGSRLLGVSRPDLATLEEALGWAIPTSAQHALNLAAFDDDRPPPGDEAEGPLPPDAAGTRAYRPQRASLVAVGGDPPASYGALLRAEPVVRRWRPGPVELDLFGGQTDDGLAAIYRLSEAAGPGQPAALMFVGVMTGIPDTGTVGSDEVIRGIVRHLAVRAVTDGSLTLRQHAFLARHSELLAGAAVEAADHPYPRGTRIAVHDGDPARAATGTVAAVVDGPTGPEYLWRPDIADLPGHPWQHQPTWALRTAAHQAEATLEGSDRGVDGPGAPQFHMTGAVVATVDDARFATATVLRTLVGAGPDLVYEVQPLDTALGPVRLPAAAVVALRAAAWRSLDDLLAARQTAGLPVVDSEVLVTSEDWALALVDGGETFLSVQRDGGRLFRALPDPTRGASPNPVPAGLHRPATLHTSAGSGRPTLRQDGGRIQVEDPVFGRIEVGADAFHTAIRHPAAELAGLLARRPWLPSCDGRPLFVVAALAVQHAPAELGLLSIGPPPVRPPSGEPTGPVAGGPPLDPGL